MVELLLFVCVGRMVQDSKEHQVSGALGNWGREGGAGLGEDGVPGARREGGNRRENNTLRQGKGRGCSQGAGKGGMPWTRGGGPIGERTAGELDTWRRGRGGGWNRGLGREGCLGLQGRAVTGERTAVEACGAGKERLQ